MEGVRRQIFTFENPKQVSFSFPSLKWVKWFCWWNDDSCLFSFNCARWQILHCVSKRLEDIEQLKSRAHEIKWVRLLCSSCKCEVGNGANILTCYKMCCTARIISIQRSPQPDPHHITTRLIDSPVVSSAPLAHRSEVSNIHDVLFY